MGGCCRESDLHFLMCQCVRPLQKLRQSRRYLHCGLEWPPGWFSLCSRVSSRSLGTPAGKVGDDLANAVPREALQKLLRSLYVYLRLFCCVIYTQVMQCHRVFCIDSVNIGHKVNHKLDLIFFNSLLLRQNCPERLVEHRRTI